MIVTTPPARLAELPPVNEIPLPARTALLPTDKLMAPPAAPLEEPLAIAIAPAEALLAPEEMVTVPDTPAAVDVVEPEPTTTAPLSSPAARDAADVKLKAPVAAVESD